MPALSLRTRPPGQGTRPTGRGVWCRPGALTGRPGSADILVGEDLHPQLADRNVGAPPAHPLRGPVAGVMSGMPPSPACAEDTVSHVSRDGREGREGGAMACSSLRAPWRSSREPPLPQPSVGRAYSRARPPPGPGSRVRSPHQRGCHGKEGASVRLCQAGRTRIPGASDGESGADGRVARVIQARCRGKGGRVPG